MTKKELRERKVYVSDILEATIDAIDFLKGDNETAHWRTLQWLLPQVQDAHNRLENGEELGQHSRDMVPVDAALMVLQHFDYMVQEAMDEVDDEMEL